MVQQALTRGWVGLLRPRVKMAFDLAPLMRYKDVMSNKLARRGRKGGGIVPAVGSAVVPGLGQLINGDGDKALGVFAVSVLAGLGFWGGLPLIGTAAGLVALGTWIYGVADGYAGKR